MCSNEEILGAAWVSRIFKIRLKEKNLWQMKSAQMPASRAVLKLKWNKISLFTIVSLIWISCTNEKYIDSVFRQWFIHILSED